MSHFCLFLQQRPRPDLREATHLRALQEGSPLVEARTQFHIRPDLAVFHLGVTRYPDLGALGNPQFGTRQRGVTNDGPGLDRLQPHVFAHIDSLWTPDIYVAFLQRLDPSAVARIVKRHRVF